jgi:hypothetical protein
LKIFVVIILSLLCIACAPKDLCPGSAAVSTDKNSGFYVAGSMGASRD